MNSFQRLIPFLRPHRRKFVLSVVFALLVAVLWSLNMTLVGPMVTVLNEQTIHEYVDQRIEEADHETIHHTRRLEETQAELDALVTASPAPSSARLVDLREDLARERRELSTASNELFKFNWIKTYVLPHVPRDKFDTLALIMGIVLVATLLKGVFIFIQDVLIGSVVELISMSLRKACFRKVLQLDYQTIALKGTADLMSRFTNDMNVLANGLSLLGGKIVREPLKAACCIVAAFVLNWRLTLLSFVFAPLAVLLFYRIGKLLKRASRRLMESMSRIYKTLEETFDSVRIVIAFEGSRRQRLRFHHESKEYYAKAMKLVRIDALTSPTTEVLGMFALFVALLPGAYLVLRGTDSIWGIKLVAGSMNLAELAVLYTLLIGVIDPIRKLSSVYAKLKRSAAAADRVFSLLDCETLVKPAKNPQPLPRLETQIEFRNIEFVYASADADESQRPAALDDVSLTIPAGEIVAVVGENGSGKSTLVNLLPRFYDPNRGSVRIDDVDIRETSLHDLRSQIAVVTQETVLFDTSIYENIAYGKPHATEAEVLVAAEKAHVLKFVDQLPDGIYTQIGQKGGQLSGGQRQRIAMARALLRDPAILILDEATSAVDAHSEFLMHQTLREFSAGRTVFLITHSVSQSVLDFVTRIVVMEQGRIVTTGTHESLLETCTRYQNLHQAQQRQRSA